MPHLRIQTNSPLNPDKRDALLQNASKLIAEHLHKPEAYVMVSLQDNLAMSFGGTTAPAAYLHLESIGFRESPQDLTPILCAFAEEHLEVPADRTYVNFLDLAREHYGWNGQTFEVT